jgi:hypothetical protein
MNYEYEFVRIELKGWFSLRPVEDYQAIIERHAQEGWRLVQIFAPATNSRGFVRFYELIFERERSPNYQS